MPFTKGQLKEYRKKNKDDLNCQRRKKYATQKKQVHEKENVNTIFVSNPKYECAKKTLANLKKYLRRGKEFPTTRFKEFLFRQNTNFWTAFQELLTSNQSQKKLCLPLTLETLQEWKKEWVEDELAKSKKSVLAFNYPLHRFRYQVNNNRLWYRGQEILDKEVNERGKHSFHYKNPGESKDWIYLEIALEKNYQLRAYCQDSKDDNIHCYQSYFSYKKKNLIDICFYLRDEITKVVVKKRQKEQINSLLKIIADAQEK